MAPQLVPDIADVRVLCVLVHDRLLARLAYQHHPLPAFNGTGSIEPSLSLSCNRMRRLMVLAYTLVTSVCRVEWVEFVVVAMLAVSNTSINSWFC